MLRSALGVLQCLRGSAGVPYLYSARLNAAVDTVLLLLACCNEIPFTIGILYPLSSFTADQWDNPLRAQQVGNIVSLAFPTSYMLANLDYLGIETIHV